MSVILEPPPPVPRGSHPEPYLGGVLEEVYQGVENGGRAVGSSRRSEIDSILDRDGSMRYDSSSALPFLFTALSFLWNLMVERDGCGAGGVFNL
jgi:hypothetical protein